MTTKELSEIRKILSDLQTKINNIENKIPAINTISESLEKIQNQFDKINDADEKERKRSLVFTRMPESEKTKPSARQADDHQMVKCVLDELGVECSAVVYRMGVHDPTKKGLRLLKVILPARRFQIQALKNWTKKRDTIRQLVGSDKFAIRWSETAEERAEK
uniref:Uncharacterized protein n=1 Tax=Meloidogyne javanica TaxID=6303 RepID=A0A915N483_MELJA